MNEAAAQLDLIEIVEAAPFVARIKETWQRGAEAILETGRILIEAKAALEHGAFGEMIRHKLPFGPRHAQRLMQIAQHPFLAKPGNAQLLPPDYGALYELSRLEPDDLCEIVRPDLKLGEARAARTEKRRLEVNREMRRLADNPLALPAGPWCVGVADPPWEDPDNPIGFNDRHYRYKYPTMTPAAIAALPVKPIFAEMACLALWITDWHLLIGSHLSVLPAWGFDPRRLFVWDKITIGTGNGYARDVTEHLIIATRGKVKVPPAKLRPASRFAIKKSGKHSEKPQWAEERLEEWYACKGVVLFEREQVRAGWTGWGNELKEAA
jgi:N6-adenosine-specific RNA methylase IME4